MASRATAICLSSGSDSDDPAMSVSREAARRTAAAKEAKLRAEAHQRDVAAAIAVGTGPNAVKKPILSDAQTLQLVSSYRRYYSDYCLDMRNRSKRVTQDFPFVVWEKVYGDFKTRFPEVTLEQSVLKTRMRVGLRDPRFWQSAAAAPAALAPASVPTSRMPATAVGYQPIAPVSTGTRGRVSSMRTVVPASAAAFAVQPMATSASLASGNANPQAPLELQAQEIDTASSYQFLDHELSMLPLEEQYDKDLKRRAKENHTQLKKLKKQKRVLKNLKLALELDIISRAECLEQGEFIADMWREQRGIGSISGVGESMTR